MPGLKVLAMASVSQVRDGFTAIRGSTAHAYRSMRLKFPIAVAPFWHRVYVVRYCVSRWKLRHGASTGGSTLLRITGITKPGHYLDTLR